MFNSLTEVIEMSYKLNYSTAKDFMLCSIT